MELPTVLVDHVLSFLLHDTLPEHWFFALFSARPAPLAPPDVRTLVSVGACCKRLRSSPLLKRRWERLLRRDFVGENLPLLPGAPHENLYGKMFLQLRSFVRGMHGLSSSPQWKGRHAATGEEKRRLRSPAVIDAWEREHGVVVPFVARMVCFLPVNLPGVAYFDFEKTAESPLKPPCRTLVGGGGEYGEYWSNSTSGVWIELRYGGMSHFVDVEPSSKTFGHLTEIDDANPFFETRVEPKGEMLAWMTGFEFTSRYTRKADVLPMSHNYSEYVDGLCETIHETKFKSWRETEDFTSSDEEDEEDAVEVEEEVEDEGDND